MLGFYPILIAMVIGMNKLRKIFKIWILSRINKKLEILFEVSEFYNH
jgi:hypothetical protein